MELLGYLEVSRCQSKPCLPSCVPAVVSIASVSHIPSCHGRDPTTWVCRLVVGSYTLPPIQRSLQARMDRRDPTPWVCRLVVGSDSICIFYRAMTS